MTRDLFDKISHSGDGAVNGNYPASADTIDLEMVLHYDTGKAIQVSDTGEESRAVWLPKSQIQINNNSGKTIPATKKDGQRTVLPVITVSIPEWLAKDKGLI